MRRDSPGPPVIANQPAGWCGNPQFPLDAPDLLFVCCTPCGARKTLRKLSAACIRPPAAAADNSPAGGLPRQCEHWLAMTKTCRGVQARSGNGRAADSRPYILTTAFVPHCRGGYAPTPVPLSLRTSDRRHWCGNPQFPLDAPDLLFVCCTPCGARKTLRKLSAACIRPPAAAADNSPAGGLPRQCEHWLAMTKTCRGVQARSGNGRAADSRPYILTTAFVPHCRGGYAPTPVLSLRTSDRRHWCGNP